MVERSWLGQPPISSEMKDEKTKLTLAILVACCIVVTVILAIMTLPYNIIFFSKHMAYAHHIIEQIPIPSRPMGLSLSSSENSQLLYVSNFGLPLVSIINTTSNKPIGNINIYSKTGVMAVEAIPQKLYIAPFEGGVLEVYDSNTKNLTKMIPLPNSETVFTPPPISEQNNGGPLSLSFLTGGWSMTYDHNNGMLYVANYNANQIDIIDTIGDKAVGTISVPVHPINVKVDPDNGILLVTSLAGDALTFISTKTNQILNTISTGAAPWGLDIDKKEKLAYVANRGTNYITVVNIPKQTIITNIPIGAPAQAITVDDNEHMIYASYMDQPKIVKIDGKTNAIVNTIDMSGAGVTGGGGSAEVIPQDIIADPSTHTLYVSNKYANTIFVLGPNAISTTIPVIARDTPAALVIGNITAHGLDVQVSEPFVDIKIKRIIMNVNSPDGGELALRIPRSVLDARDNNGNDIAFKVSVNGNPIQYQEKQKQVGKLDYREITLFVPKNSKMIDIVGTNTVNIPYVSR
ncbi:MAG TPA: YncE family protein [Nitrososphaeraceae archaeon]|nr:YncE family protein [Nitrososphaeraceae archaeon]